MRPFMARAMRRFGGLLKSGVATCSLSDAPAAPMMRGMMMEPLARLERHAKRLGEIAAVAGKYGLSEFFGFINLAWFKERLKSADGQALAGLSTEARIRLALTELGTTFIKFGQMLSTRADLVGAELAAELSGLQANVPAESAEAARALLEAQLGRPIDACFAGFDDTPLAAASIAQVHAARLPTGEAVVVKIRRSGIEAKVITDLEIVQLLAELLEKHSPSLRAYQPVAIIRQFRRALLRELDFSYERRNLETFARRFAAEPAVHIPRVFEDLCSHEVITMERLQGIPGTDIERLRHSGENLAEFARRGANMYLEMVFRDGFYHADPHPGNLLLMPDGSVGVLDCGMVGRIDEAMRADVEAMLVAAVERDAEELADVVMRIGAAPLGADRQALRADLGRFLDDYVHQSLRDIDVGAALGDMLDIVRQHHVVLPAQLALLLRTCIVLEGTSRSLDRDFSFADLAQPFYLQGMRSRLDPRMLWRRVRRSTRDWERLFAAMPRDLRLVLDRCREGTFRIQFEHRNLDAPANRLTLGILVAALVISGAALWTSAAPPLLGRSSIPGLLSYALAVHLALRLWRSTRGNRTPDGRTR